MSVFEVLQAAHDANVLVHVDGDNLMLKAATPPPETVIDLLARLKTDLIAVLPQVVDCWPEEEWVSFYNERAAIAEVAIGSPEHPF